MLRAVEVVVEYGVLLDVGGDMEDAHGVAQRRHGHDGTRQGVAAGRQGVAVAHQSYDVAAGGDNVALAIGGRRHIEVGHQSSPRGGVGGVEQGDVDADTVVDTQAADEVGLDARRALIEGEERADMLAGEELRAIAPHGGDGYADDGKQNDG